MLYSAVFGVVSAMVGAGFASGREIIRFFSQYGHWSWGLAMLAAAVMGGMMYALMNSGPGMDALIPSGKLHILGKTLFLLLLTATGGAMTAAAGELAALTVPLLHARSMGSLLTLCACVACSRKTIVFLGWVGKALVPLLLTAFFLCFRLPSGEAPQFPMTLPKLLLALLQLLGYCGLNVTLSAGVILEAGKGKTASEKRKIVLLTSAVLGFLLLGGNAALLPHGAKLQDASLPMVMLLKDYGKTGFYLSAVLLYLAVFSTLVAVLRGMRDMLGNRGVWAGLMCGAASLLGFSEIVGSAYPMLGWLGLLLLFGKLFFKAGTNCFPRSSNGRKPNEEEGNQ